MINFSFTISPFLKTELDEIDKLRVKTLVTLLPPTTEFTQQHEAMLVRVSSTLSLIGLPTRPIQIKKALSTLERRLTTEEKMIVTLHHTFTLLYLEWFMNNQPITFASLQELNNRFQGKSLAVQQKDLELMLSFIQANPEHPVIQAALVRVLIHQTLGTNQSSSLLGILTSWIFLLKHGYDFKKLLIHEEDLVRRATPFTEVMNMALANHNLSSFLEYYTHEVLMQAEKVNKTLKEDFKDQKHMNIQIKLSNRQKEILAFMEKPGITISNRQVQKMFGVSQITASRDLSALVQYGLIFPVGKGRSATYSIIK